MPWQWECLVVMDLSYLSVCSGIEAASVAWERLGFRPAAFAEIDKFPAAVLAHHWPRVPNVGDMLLVPALLRARLIYAPPILVGGTPCQSYSVAGKRRGLEDPRGQLTLAYVEILNTIDEIRGCGNECTAVWENVPGVLSDRGNAFGEFLGRLTGSDCPVTPGEQGGKFWRQCKKSGDYLPKWPSAGAVIGPRRAVAWRVLDAQYFGVAQRRRRLFVVASALPGFDPTAVLFDWEGVRRDVAPDRAPGQNTTRTDNASAPVGGIPDVASTITTGARRSDRGDGTDNLVYCIATAQGAAEHQADLGAALTCNHEAPIVFCGDVAPTLNAGGNETGGHRPPGSTVDTSEALVVHGTQDPIISSELAHCLGRNNGQENALFKYGGVRRLMPLECARLQGFPDDHCAIPWRGAPPDKCPDGPQYKAYGNSMNVANMACIGERLKNHDYLRDAIRLRNQTSDRSRKG